MSGECRLEVMNPATLDETAREELADELKALSDQIFIGVSRAELMAEVLTPPARRTRLQLLRDASGTLIGYCGVHLYEKRVLGRQQLILRSEAGLLPAYRGSGCTLRFGLRQTLTCRLRHPFRRLDLFCTLVHPSSYRLLAGRFAEMSPLPGRPVPPDTRALMQGMAEAFGECPVAWGDKGLRRVGWITRDSEHDRQAWETSEAPEVRFFLKRNPGYRQGIGLVVLVPLSWHNLLRSAWRRLRRGHSRGLGGRPSGYSKLAQTAD
ncbi:hypothetical protein [Halomonas sp. YLGW01]|uniref:hypothetical protein n=1 Tax=Halomonas sp. YLGW01 TaxID=2773308 RepID=UPI0017823F6B|nr:hypothetical protein [Halomonas sp. YLGW01]